MIFSKDKKPTKAGLYWNTILCDNGEHATPFAIRVVEIKAGLCVRFKTNDLDLMSHVPLDVMHQTLWGDRIETPTVEAAMSGKGEA